MGDNDHKVEPPEQSLDDRHSFTDEQYFRHRYHSDPVFKHMYDRAHEEVEAMRSTAKPADAQGLGGQAAERFSRDDAIVASMLAQQDTTFESDPESAYRRAVATIKANKTARHPDARW